MQLCGRSQLYWVLIDQIKELQSDLFAQWNRASAVNYMGRIKIPRTLPSSQDEWSTELRNLPVMLSVDRGEGPSQSFAAADSELSVQALD